ncbi:MAG: hypothetical protein R2882_04140 [Gemmatimonadales bacterium]
MPDLSAAAALAVAAAAQLTAAQRTMKPVLHGCHWVAITGSPSAPRPVP